ncbi:MAG: ATP-binding protein [Cytophagales bacterium]|nr:ATP-binding protein [Cytophagales bacterium]
MDAYQSILVFNVFVSSVLLFSALLAAIHYGYTSDKSYLFYGGYLASMFLYFLLDVLVLPYTEKFLPGWKNHVYTFAVPVNVLPFYLYLRFANEFVFFQKFNTSIFKKVASAANFLLVYVCIDRVLVHVFDNAELSVQLWFFAKLAFALFILFLLSEAFQTDNRLAKVFATGTLCFVVGGLAKICHEKLFPVPQPTTILWRSPFFFMQVGVLFEVLFFNLGLIYRTRQLNREHTELQLREQETRKTKELNEFKSRFYANITHEFRTPMTVILGLCDHLLGQPRDKMAQSVAMIKRNGEQLLELVNEILALSKAETDQLPGNRQTGDLVLYLRYLAESFRPLCQVKSVTLAFRSSVPPCVVAYDAGKWKSIVSNLLSNALKFTPATGRITVELARIESGKLRLRVTDSGVGIPADDLPHVFERYFQADNQSGQTGTGIGLALVKEYVHAMQGEVAVESRWGGGTTFTVTVPLSSVEEVPIALPEVPPVEAILENDNDGEKPVVLVVEDNADVAHYVQLCLQEHYAVISAKNGQIGLETARQQIPDVVVSDVMMPERDGYELCGQLKADELTNHIPVVLLTAKAAHEHRLEGLAQGADAYLTKPFDCRELVLTCNKLIDLRRTLREKYRRNWDVAATAEAIAEPTVPDPFLVRLREAVEARLDDGTFGPTQLAEAVHLSRSQLHRKLKAVAGVSAAHFIRNVRLGHARILLQTTQRNVSEIAYAVGFDDPNYFTRVFTETVGTQPTYFRRNPATVSE